MQVEAERKEQDQKGTSSLVGCGVALLSIVVERTVRSDFVEDRHEKEDGERRR